MGIKTKYKNQLDETQTEILNELLKIGETAEVCEPIKLSQSDNRSLALNLYLESIGSVHNLSIDEEKKISIKISEGEFSESRKLVKANLDLVAELAENYDLPDEAVLDLIYEGNIALKQAAKTYTVQQEQEFREFAKPKIQASFKKVFTRLNRCFKLSCFACMLLATFAKADATPTNSIDKQILEKPNYINSTDWSYIQENVKRTRKKYGITEGQVLSFIKQEMNYQRSISDVESLQNQTKRDVVEQGYHLASLNDNLKQLESQLDDYVHNVNLWKVIDDEVNKSVSKRLGSDSEWIVKTPSFLKKLDDRVMNIEVQFPNGLVNKSGMVVAQVWVDSGTGKNLFAVPIQVESYGGDTVDTVLASAS